jgi:hypothetical protein
LGDDSVEFGDKRNRQAADDEVKFRVCQGQRTQVTLDE